MYEYVLLKRVFYENELSYKIMWIFYKFIDLVKIYESYM